MINYVDGNVLDIKPKSTTIIPHCVNSSGVMGSGVALYIARKWPHVEDSYLKFYKECVWKCNYTNKSIPWLLGEVQFIEAEKNIVVANFIGQKAPGVYKTINGKRWPPARKESVNECLARIADVARKINAKIAAPKFCSMIAVS